MGIKFVKDDYGWEIPLKKVYNVYESLKEELGVEELYRSMELALGTDEWKELIADVARDYDEDTDDSDELLAYLDFEEILDDLVKKMSSDDLADNLAYICRMNNIEIPELVHEEDMDDALWINADNDSPEAGRLTLKRPIEYTSDKHPDDHYLIVTRIDGLFDVYTRHDYDLVGVGFKTVEEAKANIDEGRTKPHVVTPEEKLDGEKPEREKVAAAKKPDPSNKVVDYKGFRLKKLETGEWQISSAGDSVGMEITLTRAPSFEAAVKYLFKNTMAPKPTGTDKKSQLLKEYLEV